MRNCYTTLRQCSRSWQKLRNRFSRTADLPFAPTLIDQRSHKMRSAYHPNAVMSGLYIFLTKAAASSMFNPTSFG